MSSQRIYAFLDSFRRECPDLEVRLREPMSEHTTFRIGGRVSAMASPRTRGEAVSLILALREENIPHMVLGRGSNVLFSDEEHELLVVSTDGLDAIEVTGESVAAGAGARLYAIAKEALRHSLTGFEFAHGIPGSLGGAVFMNAGAYGGEMRDIIESVTYLDAGGELREIPRGECGFGYRRSIFEENGGVILSAKLRLTPGDPEAIAAKMEDLAARRRDKQPLNYPSAGSTFKRPAGGYAAALIDSAGLKGRRLGDAQVSEKHAGFIVNVGAATFRDVTGLMEIVRREVLARSGVELEPEVRIID